MEVPEMPRKENKKVVQKLKSEKLKKIRYELRTLLRLEKEKRWNELQNRFGALSNDKSITYEECVRKQDFIIRKQEELNLAYRHYPHGCSLCGDRMENLVYNPVKYQWRCLLCYEQAHKKFPEDYP